MLQKTFCSSPWFHLRMTYNGSFESCRWAKNPIRKHNFQNTSIIEYYNSDQMRSLRNQLLLGESPEHCSSCYYEESFGKLNGRLRQLNKSAIDADNFDLTIRSSPHYQNFEYSLKNNGLANMSPVDLQIELGNVCNSACVMCVPEASSRLEQDYYKLNKIDPNLFKLPSSYQPWTKDKNLIDRFIKELSTFKNLKYVHFLGGETFYEEAFYTICDELVKQKLSSDVIVGTTTNGTIYNERIESYIKNFKQFHLGISIESVTDLNDYIRWPSKVAEITMNIEKFLNLRATNPGLYISLRITPNVFSIYDIDKLFEFMIEKNVTAESCNILSDPKLLRMELMPDDIRQEVEIKLEKIIDTYELNKQQVVNARNPNSIKQVIANVINDYYKFIKDYKTPDDIETSRKELVTFLKAFEQIRGNSILDHAPRYEQFLRNYGY